MDYNKIAELVKTERNKLQLTQAGLAKLTEVSVTTIKSIEKGKKVYLETLKKVLNLFGYDIVIVKADALEIIKF